MYYNIKILFEQLKKKRVVAAGVAASCHRPPLYHVISTQELYENYQNLLIYRLKQLI